MPPEGSNESEELLKRYARERREQGANPSLHPATRRLLQGEVTRQYGKQSAPEKGGLSIWLGKMRGRLAMTAALAAVVVTGVCLWWNNQQPRKIQMAKAEQPAKEMALRFDSIGDETKITAERQVAAADGIPAIRLNGTVDRLVAAPATEARPKQEAKLSEMLSASVAPETIAPLTAALKDAPDSSTTSVYFADKSLGDVALNLAVAPTESVSTTVAQRAEMAFDGSSLSSSRSRAFFSEAAGSGKATTNRTDLALGYGLAGAAPTPVESRTASPSVAVNYDTDEGKDLSKPSDTGKLAVNRPVTLARNDGAAIDPSRRAALEPRASPAQSPPAAPPVQAFGGSLSADKRQQPVATSPLPGAPVAQASAARPEPVEQMARFYRESVIRPDAGAKQKALRELERREAEPAVLNRFVIEQQGNSVRVVDADGSIYNGTVEEPVVAEFDADLFQKSAEKKDPLTREKSVALKSAPDQRTDGYSFRASGSNVTLQQLVVVNGRLVTGVNTAPRRGSAGVAGGLGRVPANAPARTLKESAVSNRGNTVQPPGFGGRYGFTTNQSATIEGTVRIGTTNQRWFRAVRDPR